MEVVQVAGLGEEAATHDRESRGQGRGLHPGLLELDFDFAVFAGEGERDVAEVTGVDVGFQVDFHFARGKAGLAGADLAGRLEAGDLFPAAAHVGKATVEHGADGRVEGVGRRGARRLLDRGLFREFERLAGVAFCNLRFAFRRVEARFQFADAALVIVAHLDDHLPEFGDLVAGCLCIGRGGWQPDGQQHDCRGRNFHCCYSIFPGRKCAGAQLRAAYRIAITGSHAPCDRQVGRYSLSCKGVARAAAR